MLGCLVIGLALGTEMDRVIGEQEFVMGLRWGVFIG